MIADKTVLAIVPARGGSKGVLRKNVRELAGKPLIAWTVETALASRHIDRLVLSSDDDEIMRVAQEAGCEVPFRRPAHLATDEADAMSVVTHALTALEQNYDYVVLLQPTSPLRQIRDIDGAIAACHERRVSSCVSVCPTEKNPYWMFTIDGEGPLRPLMEGGPMPSRRQAGGRIFALNGAIYVARRQTLEATGAFINADTIGYVMPRDRSLDIDDEFDFFLAGLLLGSRPGGQNTPNTGA
jgi:CMP-N,N'-diacetyllegionaminic acid synthase